MIPASQKAILTANSWRSLIHSIISRVDQAQSRLL